MPLENTATETVAAPTSPEVSFEDALALLGDDAPEATAPKPATKGQPKATEPDNDLNVLADPDEIEENIEDEVEAAPAASDLTDETLVDLGEGKTAKLADLKQAHASFEQSKIATTRVMQEVATERSNLHTLGSNMAQALENVSQYLVQRLPPEPDQNLAYSDPAEHYRQTIIRNNAIAELQDMLSVSDGSKEAVAMLSDADFKALKADEDQKWIASMPSMRKEQFPKIDAKAKAYAKSLGFNEQEVETTADHRLRSTFWKAARYEEIMANATKAKGKIENASTMAPQRARTQHPNSQAALEQVNARKVLAKSGRLDDALKLNW